MVYRCNAINVISCRGFRIGINAGRSGHDYVPPMVLDGNSDGNIYLIPGGTKRPPGPKTVEEFKNPTGYEKNWLSLGISFTQYDEDRKEYHFYVGMSVIIIFVLVPFYRIYSPDQLYWGCPERIWAKREARLRLEQREKLGLPLIDPDYVPRHTVKLPPMSEIERIYQKDPERWNSPGYDRLNNRYDLTMSGDEILKRQMWGDPNQQKPRLDKMVIPTMEKM